MGAADYWSPNLRGSDLGAGNPAEHLNGLKLTEGLLPALGVEPLIGRFFAPGEDQAGADHEVILSYRLWQRLLNGWRDVLGHRLMLNGEAYTVIGVMPRTFQFAPFWATHVPNAFGNSIYDRGGNHLRVFARLEQA